MEEVLGQCCTDDGRCSLCCPVGCWALEMWLVWLKNWMLNFVSFKKNLRFKQLVWLLATILESANLECLTFRQPGLQTGESGSWYGNQELSRQSRLWNIWSPHRTPPCADRSWKGWSLSLCSVVSNLYSLSWLILAEVLSEGFRWENLPLCLQFNHQL